MMKPLAATLLTLAAALALSACGNGSLDDDDVSTSAEAIEGTSDTNALMAVSAEAAATTMAPEGAAVASAQSARAQFSPAGCVVATQQGATVNYTFNNCTGPYGLVNLSGTASATFSNRTPTGWTVTLTGSLMANQAQLRPNATAQISYANGTRTANVTLMGSGTSRRGVAYQNTGSYTSTWDGSCFGLNGSLTANANGASVSIAVNNYRRCRGQCPEAGGSIALSNSNGDALSIAYSGSATAQVTGGRGVTRSVRLYCGGAS
ncbi:MAG: hypothetical protein JNK72_15175 [Myxococcales bacterium]|nr:hypothetical protein [Myxococcales bacterium]